MVKIESTFLLIEKKKVPYELQMPGAIASIKWNL